MKHITITSVLAIMMAIPSFAAVDINANATSADCDNNTLHTTTGPATLTADWSANTINLEWYSDDTKLTVPTASNTCVYDGGITIPTTNPTKAGYEFAGWQVRQQCLPSNFNYNITSGYGFTRLNGGSGYKESTYGLTKGSGEWAVEFSSSGVIKGMAKCSAKRANTNNGRYDTPSSEWTASESDLTSAGDGGHCWCQITGYDADKDKNYCPVASAAWFWISQPGSASSCASTCANNCGSGIKESFSTRTAIFTWVI